MSVQACVTDLRESSSGASVRSDSEKLSAAIEQLEDALARVRSASSAAVDELSASEPSPRRATISREVGHAVVATVAAERALTGVRVQLLAGCAKVRPWTERGHTAPTGWLAHETRRRRGECRREISAANALHTTPSAGLRLSRGEIGLDHLRLIQSAAALDGARWERQADQTLAGMASSLDYDDFEHAVDHWRAWAEPDSAAAAAERAEEHRSVRLSPGLGGTILLGGQLTHLGGAEVRGELDRLAEIELEADWASARSLLGDAATYSDLARTPTQRRADALLQMARRSASTAAPGEPAPVELALLMSWNTWCSELSQLEVDSDGAIRHSGDPLERPTEPPDVRARPGHPDGPTKRVYDTLDGHVIAPSTAIDASLRGHVRRVVIGPDGNVLDFGRSKRFYTGALRRAIQFRDRRCIAPGCRVPARQCEVDHHHPWSEGGHTDEANGDLICPHHHPDNRQNRKRWEAQRRSDREPA